MSATGEATDLSNLPDAPVVNIKVAETKQLFFVLHVNFLKHIVPPMENGKRRNSNLNTIHPSEEVNLIQ